MAAKTVLKISVDDDIFRIPFQNGLGSSDYATMMATIKEVLPMTQSSGSQSDDVSSSFSTFFHDDRQRRVSLQESSFPCFLRTARLNSVTDLLILRLEVDIRSPGLHLEAVPASQSVSASQHQRHKASFRANQWEEDSRDLDDLVAMIDSVEDAKEDSKMEENSGGNLSRSKKGISKVEKRKKCGKGRKLGTLEESTQNDDCVDHDEESSVSMLESATKQIKNSPTKSGFANDSSGDAGTTEPRDALDAGETGEIGISGDTDARDAVSANDSYDSDDVINIVRSASCPCLLLAKDAATKTPTREDCKSTDQQGSYNVWPATPESTPPSSPRCQNSCSGSLTLLENATADDHQPLWCRSILENATADDHQPLMWIPVLVPIPSVPFYSMPIQVN
eukprot:TRINITY_DN15054_c2_g1_i1.p1 TRINITY_DN15054_c2_g1~~TRINITY_DN15054_c2_g1_i1.p1  ORF type:complete len:424 (-),score=83.30 TRINITY_DN15054_c2_g1_i1:59-1237(-)